MEGARDRAAQARALTWYGAMLPHFKKPISFEDFVRPKPARARQSRAELQMMCDALAAAWGAKFKE